MDYNELLTKIKFNYVLEQLKKELKDKKILLYGAGEFFDYIENKYDLSDLNIIGISDKKFETESKEYYLKKYKIIKPSDIKKQDIDCILLTTLKTFSLLNILNKNYGNGKILIMPLVKMGSIKNDLIFDVIVNLNQIDFKIEKIDYEKEEIVLSNKDLHILTNFQYPWIAQEIYYEKIYDFKTQLDKSKKYCVIDIGANRCYASLYFAKQEWVDKVISFEMVPQTVEFAQKVLALNPKYTTKIDLHAFGLGKENQTVEIKRLPHRDGCNTTNDAFFNNYMPEEIGKEVIEKCKIRKASEVLKDIIEKNSIDNIILKIDVEGAEYDIFEDLKNNYPTIFDKMVLIIGETHLGFEDFYKYIPQDKFTIVSTQKQENGCCPFEIRRINL